MKKKEKKNNSKNITKKLKFNNDEKLPLYNQSLNKTKKINNDHNKSQSQNLLKAKCNYRKLNSINNNFKKILLNNNKKLNPKNETQKINYFRNDISNLTLNMTFEQKNISTENPNLNNIYISSIRNENTNKDNNNQTFNQYELNNMRNVNKDNKEFKVRHSLAIHGNYILFDFNKELNRNKSYINKDSYTNYEMGESSMRKKLNFSLNKHNLIRNHFYKYSKTYNDNDNNDIDILNKTKEILNIKENNTNILKENKIKNNKLNNSQPVHCFKKSCLKIKKNNSFGKLNNNNKNINEKRFLCSNIDYFSSSRFITDEFSSVHNNYQEGKNAQLNKNKRPCSLYINKKVIEKKPNNSINNNNDLNNCFSLNEFYINPVNKDNNITTNMENNYFHENTQKVPQSRYQNEEKENIIFNYEDDISEDNSDKIRIKSNLYDKRFINLNYDSSPQQLINKRLKFNSIFKFNRNKCDKRPCSSSLLNYVPSFNMYNNIMNE